MSDLNRVILVGRLTRDAELKYHGETAMCSFSIAVNRSRKDQNGNRNDEVSYIDIVLWGRLAEAISKYMQKGKQVAVEGCLKQDRWTDQNSNQRSRLGVIAENVQLIGGQNPGENAPKSTQNIPNPDPFDDDGIPF